jgi:hypothetical protein
MRYRSSLYPALLGWLLLIVMRSSLAQDACVANFTHGGDSKTGLTFTANMTVAGVDARGGIEQMKSLAASAGFEIGADEYRENQGTLTIQQKAREGARGFPAYITANDAGNVSINMTLPAGMKAKPEDVRQVLCGMLLALKPSSASNPRVAKSSAASTAALPVAVNRPTMATAFGPVDTTKLCMANFTTVRGDIEGDTFSTWSMTSSLDPHAAIALIKQMVAAVQDFSVASEDYHGHEGDLMVVMKSADSVRDHIPGFGLSDKRGFPFHIIVDGDLAALSFTAQVNPEQKGIIAARMEFHACSLFAAATGSTMPPNPPKGAAVSDYELLGESERSRNPFKNTPQARAKQAQQDTKDRVETRLQASTTLYRRAIASGKAVVAVPGVDFAEKFKGARLLPGSDSYPAYAADQDSTVIWQNKADEKGFLKVGFKESMDRVGLHGYLTGVDAGKSYYMFYIVAPGTYSITGNTAKLRRMDFPDMTSRQWSAKVPIGLASLSTFKDKEYYQTQEWFSAQYGSRTVSDGSYCDMVVMGGGTGGCAHMSEATHTETTVTDPGGWRAVTHAKSVDGVAVATKLTREFASFAVSPGEAILVDGFYANEYNTNVDTNACNQADSNLVNCSIKTYTLYRIAAHLDAMHDGPTSGLEALYLVNSRFPFDAGLVQPRQVKVVATAGEEKPGTFEAGWARPYFLSTR